MLVHVADGAVTGNRIVGCAELVAGDFVTIVDGGGPLIGQRDAQTLVEEGHLLEPLTQGLEGEDGGFEDLGIGVEGLCRTGFLGCFSADEFGDRMSAVRKRHAPHVALTADDCVDAG